jgi:putative SOS response-associated peptidase YedK
MINARAETLLEKPSFRKPFERQRCLVPAGGFYEWRKGESSRQPYLIRRRDRAPVAFAGLWEHWVNPESKEPVETFTIVTTTANELTQPIHSRMPLILSPAHFDEWLASDEPPVELLATPETPEFEAVPVSTWVNSTRHDDPRCMEPTETN